jgi:hypothetical protein
MTQKGFFSTLLNLMVRSWDLILISAISNLKSKIRKGRIF